MEHWPGHGKYERTQTEEDSKDKGKQKGHRLESNFWQWPHLEHGSIGRATLVSKDGRVQWSTVVDTSHDTRWLPWGKPAMIFPQTKPPPVNINEHSARQRADRGMQYLRSHFPDADFPSELVVGTLEADAKEMRRLRAFDPFLGNLLEIIPSHHTPNEFSLAFPMDELGRQLNISRFCPDKSGDMVFSPTGSPSFAFETPILQISSALLPSEWAATPSSPLLVRTYTSSSLLHVERSAVTRELEITRVETGDIPIVDSRILASGPDVVVVNRNGKVYKCNTHRGGKAMQLVESCESSGNDYFWQLGITGRCDECFLASCKVVKHIDMRSAGGVAGVFTIDNPSAIVTSFESPIRDYLSRITTTSHVIWLDDRFRRRPLLSFNHYRSFDRTLRVLTANPGGASLSLLTSRRNSLVTLYDVNRCSDRLLHCNSKPSCLPHAGPILTAYDGHAVAVLPSDIELTLFRLCQRGGIYRQDVRITRDNEDQSRSAQGGRVTHQWDDDVQMLGKRTNQLHVDFGPAGEKHYMKVNFRGAYEKMFAAPFDTEEVVDERSFGNMLAQLPDVWSDTEEITDTMLTTLDVISGIEGGNGLTCHPNFIAGTNIDGKQGFEALTRGQIPTQKLADLAQWHYSIQDTSIPVLNHPSADCDSLHEYLKELNLERQDVSVQSETDARKLLTLDLALSNDVYSTQKILKAHSFAAGEATPNTMVHPTTMSYNEEPPEIQFGYFCPIRKSGADHYADQNEDGEQEVGISSPLGVRLLLAEWELGTDPGDYMYHDPYGVADIDEQPIPQYRRPSAAVPSTQRKQMPLQRPPTVVAATTQPPVVHVVERPPAVAQSQAVHRTQSQQVEPGLDVFSQEPVMSTQVLPGPFGGRPVAGKKPVKKRIGGF